MKIQSIVIENFRGIKKVEVGNFKRLNFLLGKNNACKTSILEAIFLNIGISNPLLSININTFRNLKHSEEDDFRFIFHNLDYANKPYFHTKFDENEHERTLKIIPKKKQSINTQLKNKNLDQEIHESIYDTQIDKNEVNGLTFDVSIKERHQKKEKYKSEITFELASLSTTVPEDYKEKVNGVFMFPTSQAPNLDKRLEKLIVNKSHGPIIETLSLIDSSIQDLTLGTNGVIYFDIGLNRLIPINLSGDGIRRVLSILVTIADVKNGIIVIDEIDNGLHFSSQATLIKAILRAAEKYDVQVFATTHNYETLRKVKEVLGLAEYKNYSEDVTAFTIRKNPDNTLTAYPYSYEELNYIIEQEIEIR
ncbi:MAG TPA: AAA family ATPase [Saprospiraceae bacterium]|nr:AAA family ATPase [Saprospiraceae bacterium]